MLQNTFIVRLTKQTKHKVSKSKLSTQNENYRPTVNGIDYF